MRPPQWAFTGAVVPGKSCACYFLRGACRQTAGGRRAPRGAEPKTPTLVPQRVRGPGPTRSLARVSFLWLTWRVKDRS